jgi:hypothetical protein
MEAGVAASAVQPITHRTGHLPLKTSDGKSDNPIDVNRLHNKKQYYAKKWSIMGNFG